MPNLFRTFFLSLTIVCMLAYTVVSTTKVYADGDPGTPPPTTDTVTGGTDGTSGGVTDPQPPVVDLATATPIAPDQVADGTTVEVPPVAVDPASATAISPDQVTENAAVEVSPVVVDPTQAANNVATEASPVVVDPAPILDQVPNNTTVTVLDANGEAQPLVSQDSANAIATTSDPIWCPAGQAPTPGANGCTASYSSFTQLLNFLKANENTSGYQQAGTIYVQMGAYLGGESSIDFNTYGFTNLNQQNLTIQGGWDTVDNSLEPTDTSQFSVPIIIGTITNPWVGSLTLSNLTINNVGNQTGLTLYSQNDITLSTVQVTNSLNGASLNAGGDVTIDNSKFDSNKKTGATIKSGGNVTISNSSSTGNGSSANLGKGLDITSAGDVTLVSVTANKNQTFGANVVAGGTVVVINSFFSGNKSYTSNCNTKTYNGYGLQVITPGIIVLDTVEANDNNLFGASLEGGATIISNSHFNNNSSGSTKNLTGKGLQIKSSDIVVLSDVEANNNQLFGADIQAVGDVTINNSFFSGTKAYVYDHNGKVKSFSGGGYGLQVVTSGIVDLKNVAATDNYLYGAHLEGSTVSILVGDFSNNGSGVEFNPTGFGLEVISTGAVTLDTLSANNNQLFGANIQAGDKVTVKNSFFSGHQSYSIDPSHNTTNFHGYGLTVFTTAGSINLDGVEANQNNLWGASLTGSEITVANSNFNNNVTNDIVFIDDTGLLIESSGGVVTLDNVQANENRLIGATIHAAGDVLINNSVFSGNQGITCQDSNCDSSTYHGYGLNVVAGGYVELNQVTANENYLFGAHLEGSSVSIFNSTFSNNGSGDKKNPTGKGLEVISTGEVTLLNVNASHNELFGANIQATGNVTVTASVFAGNINYTYSCKNSAQGGYGLKVVSSGNILLNADENGIGNMVYDNGAEGAILEGPATVTVLDSSFNNNGATGLTITADTVVLNHVTATDNGIDGAKICANNVTVNNSVFENNGRYGLNVGSPIFTESGNIYLGNGTGSLFYNPTCNPTSSGNDNSSNDSHSDHDKDHGSKHGHHDAKSKDHDDKHNQHYAESNDKGSCHGSEHTHENKRK